MHYHAEHGHEVNCDSVISESNLSINFYRSLSALPCIGQLDHPVNLPLYQNECCFVKIHCV